MQCIQSTYTLYYLFQAHSSTSTTSQSVLGLAVLLLCGLLCLLLILPELPGKELLEFLILEFLVGLDEFRLVPDRRVSNKCRASREQSDREVECSDEGVAGSVAMFSNRKWFRMRLVYSLCFE